MSTVVSPPEKKLMTVEEFLAIPEDGIDARADQSARSGSMG